MSAIDLIQAAYNGNIQAVLQLLDDKKVNVNSTGGIYGSALGGAALGGRNEIISLLLDRGADVNITGGSCGSALGAAAWLGCREIVSLLLDRGADVNSTGGNYGSALGVAALRGMTDIVSLLLDRGADLNIRGGDYGSVLGTAAAIFTGEDNIVSILLNRGANVNIVGGKYGTALVAAAYHGSYNIAHSPKSRCQRYQWYQSVWNCIDCGCIAGQNRSCLATTGVWSKYQHYQWILPYFTGMRTITGKWIKNGDYAVLTISNPISNQIGSDFGNIL